VIIIAIVLFTKATDKSPEIKLIPYSAFFLFLIFEVILLTSHSIHHNI